jgi:putative transposase
VIGSGKFSAKKKESLVKRQYQISKKRAAEQFKGWAQSNETPIQLTFPTAGIAELAQQSLGDLLRAVGKVFIESVMDSEVEQLAGKRSGRETGRQAYRWGTESGFCIIDGQRVPIDRPRVRGKFHDKEIPLGSYELFQRASLIGESVWHKIMHGLTMRSYKEVVQQFADAYGLEKSTTSDHFIETSRLKLEELQKRSYRELNFSVMIIDGTIFKGEHLLVAIGVDPVGRKLVLGLRQGSTENATVVRGLLGDLMERGIDFTVPRLYIIDGSKAIRAAIVSYAGDAAFLQRCQVHKIRNVVGYLPEPLRPAIKFRMRAAYLCNEADEARDGLLRLHDELIEINPSAAAWPRVSRKHSPSWNSASHHDCVNRCRAPTGSNRVSPWWSASARRSNDGRAGTIGCDGSLPRCYLQNRDGTRSPATAICRSLTGHWKSPLPPVTNISRLPVVNMSGLLRMKPESLSFQRKAGHPRRAVDRLEIW